MKPFRLSRRSVLRGAGSLAIALPWLEAMGQVVPPGASPARRFLAVYTPGGTVLDKWRPTGTETAFTLSPILAPLEPVKSRLLVVDGLRMASAIGEQHQAGIVALLTGTPQSAAHRQYASGPSVDQVIASRISAGQKSKASLQVAVRWATGKSHGLLHPINSVNFENGGNFAPIPPRLDPKAIWAELFGTLGTDAASTERVRRKRSILDFVDRKYAALSARVSASDKRRIDEHLTKIRELEQSLDAVAAGGAACRKPTLVDTSDYNPTTGLASNDSGTAFDRTTDAAIPKVGKLLMDMMVMAFACDLTAVGTFQWTDTEAKHTFPWLNLTQHHHYYQHDGGYRPAECERIYTWYSEQHAYLLGEMAKVDMGGHTLLDESVVFFGTELQEPPTHSKTNMPFLVAGGGGGLRGGRFIRFNGRPHNDLLVSMLNLFGDTRTSFGTPEHCTGPLPGLT